MAASRGLVDALRQLAGSPVWSGRRLVAVAYSGGRDSTALLHATLAQANPVGVAVLALHVHHGLSARADDWLAHCEAQCAGWIRAGARLSFTSRRVQVDPRGRGVEAAARAARYAALADMARAAGCDLVLLAHHRDDQAETVLLQALRGAGMAGLAAMPQWVERHGITWTRPWLDQARAEIDGYVRNHGLTHVEDDSNADPRYARNLLRHRVWPGFVEAFPQAAEALPAVAHHAQEAMACLADLATIDLAGLQRGDGLSRSAWLALSAPRRANALRHWLAQASGAAVPASLMRRLLGELSVDRPARWQVGADHELRLYRDQIRLERRPLSDKGAAIPPTEPAREPQMVRLSIVAPGRYQVGDWAGVLQVDLALAADPGAVPLSRLANVQARPRQGGEQFQVRTGILPRSLKKQYQSAGVPTWQRIGPVLWCNERVLFVPGLGVDACWLRSDVDNPGEPLCRLQWQVLDDGADAAMTGPQADAGEPRGSPA
jgi:tRNA(Ile)-lysidine synthase